MIISELYMIIRPRLISRRKCLTVTYLKTARDTVQNSQRPDLDRGHEVFALAAACCLPDGRQHATVLMAGKLAVAAWDLQGIGTSTKEAGAGGAEGFRTTGLAMSREKKKIGTKFLFFGSEILGTIRDDILFFSQYLLGVRKQDVLRNKI